MHRHRDEGGRADGGGVRAASDPRLGRRARALDAERGLRPGFEAAIADFAPALHAFAVSAIVGTEKLRLIKVIGIVLAAAGVINLIDPRNASFSSETTLGDMMIIANSLSYGIFVATSKETITRNGAFRSMMWIFIFASIVCVPLGLWSLSSIDPISVSTNIWLLVLNISVIATAGPYLLNAYALSKVNPSIVAVYIYLQPIIGFILAVIFLNEILDLKFAVAAVLVFVGVWLTTKRKRSPFA